MTEEKSIDQVDVEFKVTITKVGLLYPLLDTMKEITLPTPPEEVNALHNDYTGVTDYELEIIKCPYSSTVTHHMDIIALNHLAAVTKERDYDMDFMYRMELYYFENPGTKPRVAAEASEDIQFFNIGSNEVEDMGYYMANILLADALKSTPDSVKPYIDYERYGGDLIANSQIRLALPGVWHLRY